MRLSIKIMVIICGIFLIMVAILHSVTASIILGSFARLEEAGMQTDLSRALNALKRDMSLLEATGGDWGAWDETRDFIADLNSEYIENNLNDTTLENLHVDFMLFFNQSGELVYAFEGNHADEDEAEVNTVSGELVGHIREEKSLFIRRDAKDTETGIVLLPDETAIITVWPVSNNYMEGPVAGTLIMGRYFGDDEVASLEEQTQLNVTFQRIDEDGLPDDFSEARSGLSNGNEIVINDDLSDTISCYSFVKDIYGRDALIVRVSTSRDVYKQGQKTTNYFRSIQLIVGIVVLAALMLTLHYMVLKPIFMLKRHVLSVGKNGDLSKRLLLKGRDEIGELSAEFDRMLDQLSDARNRLMEQSYYSGIGEMSSGVLHNIRNILTPMVGQIDKIKQRIDEAPVHNMEQAANELNAENLGHERERSLKRFMQLACSGLGGVCTDINGSIAVVLEQAAHMEAVLSQHNKAWIYKKAKEKLDLQRIIEEAVNLMPKSLRDAADIEIDKGLSMSPHVYSERIVLIQVLTNLLNNASESILRKGLKKGNIRISGASEMEGDIQKVHIVIRDNGEGIDREDLKKIFNRGYSTKVPKSAGLGLHWSANAMSAMDSDIYAESEGRGLGSAFHIKIPASNNGNPQAKE